MFLLRTGRRTEAANSQPAHERTGFESNEEVRLINRINRRNVGREPSDVGRTVSGQLKRLMKEPTSAHRPMRAACRDRTDDILFTREVLYPTELTRRGADDRDRTGMTCLEGRGTAIVLHPRGASRTAELQVVTTLPVVSTEVV